MRGKILITGGAGYIGSHAVLNALEAGYEVAVIDNLSTGNRRLIPDDVLFYEVDIADKFKIDKILASFNPVAVMHFAGSIIVPESIKDPIKYYHNNTLASLSLISSCIKTKIKNFIFSSTAAVYGITDVEKVTEDYTPKPINPYGQSKLMIERILADVSTVNEFNYCVLRYFNVAGADAKLRVGQMNKKVTHLIKTACKCALGELPIMKIYGSDYETSDGTCVRDYIHVSDLVKAHFDSLNHILSTKKSYIFNCGNGKGYSVKQILSAVEKVSGIKLKISYTGRRPGDPPKLIADGSALSKATGWRPYYDNIEDIISTALAWEKKILNYKSHK